MSVTGFNRRRRELAEDERQNEAWPSQGQEVEEEQEVQDEGIELKEMTVNELRELAKAENHTGIYSKSKAELVELLGK